MGTSRVLSALALTIAVLLAAAPAQARATGCPGSGNVLARKDGIIVFSAHRPDRNGNAGAVFVCSASTGSRSAGVPQRIYSQSATPKVRQISAAGRLVGFFVWTNAEVYSKYLVVFDRRHRRIAFKDLAECQGNDECTGPSMTAYRLASNGWVAELWPDVFSNAAGLLATDGGAHYQLDLTRVSHLRLSGDTLSWASDPFGQASVVLGPAVITPASPQPVSACGLLSDQDLVPVLGPSPSSSSTSAGQCTYTSTAYSGRQLTIQLRTGLSATQTQTAENAGDYCQPGLWWPENDNFYDQDGCSSTGGHFQYESFAQGAEVAFDLTSGPSHGDELEAHLATVALDHLFAVPIHRAG